MMPHSLKKQQGLTLITILFILIIFGFFVLLGLKITPIYMNHSKVVNALAALEEMPNIKEMSKREVEDSLSKRFNMNYVEKVVLGEDVVITKRPGYLKVETEYERVEKIAGNLSVLVEFYEILEVGDTE